MEDELAQLRKQNDMLQQLLLSQLAQKSAPAAPAPAPAPYTQPTYAPPAAYTPPASYPPPSYPAPSYPTTAPSGPSDADLQRLRDEITRMRQESEASIARLSQQGGAPSASSEQLRAMQADLAAQKAQVASLEAMVREKTAAPAAAAPAAAVTTPAAPGDIAAINTKLDTHLLGINMTWTLMTAFLVMFMQAGFALVETGFTRAKNAAHTMSMNFMVYAIGMLGYWVSGFAIEFGGCAAATSVSPPTTLGPEIGQFLTSQAGIPLGDGKFLGLFGYSGFFLPPSMLAGGLFSLFIFQGVFMDTTATIPTGAMAERWRFLPFCLFSFMVGAFIYPMYGSWVWGGGWLAALGKNFHLGHGHVDYAGSSVVHLCGGVIAFWGAKLLGPRVGKYNADGTPNPIPGHNIPMAQLGTFILAFGWFGFNPGSSLDGTSQVNAIAAVNTMLASAAGAVVGMAVTWIRFGRPDPSFMCNGMLAGLVAITGPCAFVETWSAVVIGGVAGVIVVFAAEFVEGRLKIDDPVGAVAVHGFNGAWGIIGLGLFANGRQGAGWNLVDGNVTGALYGDGGQLVASFIGVGACIVAVSIMAIATYKAVGLITPHRVSDEDQIAGLDIPELGVLAYPIDAEPQDSQK